MTLRDKFRIRYSSPGPGNLEELERAEGEALASNKSYSKIQMSDTKRELHKVFRTKKGGPPPGLTPGGAGTSTSEDDEQREDMYNVLEPFPNKPLQQAKLDADKKSLKLAALGPLNNLFKNLLPAAKNIGSIKPNIGNIRPNIGAAPGLAGRLGSLTPSGPQLGQHLAGRLGMTAEELGSKLPSNLIVVQNIGQIGRAHV